VNDFRTGEGQKGSAVILIALWLPVLLSAAALTLDVGRLFLHRIQLQAAMDLAALAGAQDADWHSLAEGVIQLDAEAAKRSARSCAADNLQALFPGQEHQIWVWVVNATPDAPDSHPLTDAAVRYPTVIVRATVEWTGGWFIKGKRRITACADASLRPRDEMSAW